MSMQVKLMIAALILVVTPARATSIDAPSHCDVHRFPELTRNDEDLLVTLRDVAREVMQAEGWACGFRSYGQIRCTKHLEESDKIDLLDERDFCRTSTPDLFVFAYGIYRGVEDREYEYAPFDVTMEVRTRFLRVDSTQNSGVER